MFLICPQITYFTMNIQTRPQISCLKGCKATLTTFYLTFPCCVFQMCLQIYILKGCVFRKVALVKHSPLCVQHQYSLFSSKPGVQSLGLVLYKHDSETWCIYVTLVGEGRHFWFSLNCSFQTDNNHSKCYILIFYITNSFEFFMTKSRVTYTISVFFLEK